MRPLSKARSAETSSLVSNIALGTVKYNTSARLKAINEEALRKLRGSLFQILE